MGLAGRNQNHILDLIYLANGINQYKVVNKFGANVDNNNTEVYVQYYLLLKKN